MPVDSLQPRSALVLIDLQHGIAAMPTAHPADDVIARAAELADAFRTHDLPVAKVRVIPPVAVGGGFVARTDGPPPQLTIDESFAKYRPELGDDDADINVTKRGWDAFTGTDLDLLLRRRDVRGLVFAGISTSIGVDSSARHAFQLGYELVIASDAVTDRSAEAHENSLTRIFPRIARVDTTAAIVAALDA